MKRLLRRRNLTNTLALLALASALAAPFQAQKKKDAASASAATVAVTPRYAVGEKLTYTVSFSNFPDAANVELYVAGRGSYFGREGVELRAHVATVGQVRAALLAVNDYFFTYADPATGLPYRAQTVAAPPAT
ncbi:MAG: hypothetical protein LC746_03015, partial [Acidobacteria bacterium]|nr:hypothetical protein [Acidobacteriota bacterium]